MSEFLNADEQYLPRYVFSYYSGESTRMYEVFRPYLESYDSQLRKGEDPGLKRLFFAMPVHSHFVLLAFLIQQTDVVREFLDDHLSLDPDEGIESVLFVMRQPPWKSKAPDGDPRFWNARGVVRDFLARLYDIALAPIEVTRKVATSIWNKETLQFKYLYIKDIAALRKLVGNQAPAEFFRDLESTYVSELIEEVRIKVRLKTNDGTVTFRELSEGEQQLLTVLGLLRFTAEDESLILLDEPDTHLNPRWSVEYFDYLKKFVGDSVDALLAPPDKHFDYVFANPPFGKKSSMTITNEEGEEEKDALTYERQDFWETTSNKQLNFVQHICTILKDNGQAAVVLPDNVLFEGGAGEKIRRKLLETCDVHTLLRLPTGIFYANGVKANVVFFDKKPINGKVHTKGVWVYDLRTNKRFTLKTRPLKTNDMRDFIACYNPENRHERIEAERFKYFPYETIIARDKASLDVFWLKDDSLDNLDLLPTPDILAQEIIDHLEAALNSFRDVAAGLASK